MPMKRRRSLTNKRDFSLINLMFRMNFYDKIKKQNVNVTYIRKGAADREDESIFEFTCIILYIR